MSKFRPSARPAAHPGPRGAEDGLRRLERALGSLDPEAHPDQLARQVVKAATAHPEVTGVRLWHVVEGYPAVWQEVGKLPAADGRLARKVLASNTKTRGTATQLVLPLGSDSGTLGALEACGRSEWSEGAKHWLELFSRFAGVALAHTEKNKAVEELSGVVEATKRLNSTLDLGELINIILQLATRQTGADRGTVFLLDRQRNEIWSLVGLGLEQQEIRISAARGIAGWVARHGETLNLKDAYNDERFEPDVDRRLGYRTRSLLCMPMRNKDGQVIGVLQLLNKRSGQFTASDEGFLGALSDHVALALENARLHRELLAKQRMERDLELARSIQRSLLPEDPPQLAGFDIAVSHQPSQMVGGDYYDFVSLSPETLLTVIADVEGKGVASALVMANLQATLRALVAHLHSLERLVGSVNNMILADTRAQKFMTFFVAMLDQRHRALHYINAGHVPPAVIRDDETLMLSEGGMVMGVFPDVPYQRGYVPLLPGDVVVGCTDGITEAMNARGDEFGNEQLIELVRQHRDKPAERIVQTVLEEVERYSRGGDHDDDRVIYVLKVL
jgi:sigma-B regulation protein RsbU (phosphoserine phosphatase)